MNYKKAIITTTKVMAWAIFAAIMFIAGIVMAVIHLLSPEQLTPIVSNAANKMLDADVEIGKVSLSANPASQCLYLDIDDLTVCSRHIKALPQAVRDTIPVWSDTLASLGHFHGGINIPQLITGVVDLKDVRITHPRINVLVVNEDINNFSVMPPTANTDTSALTLPDIRIDSMRLIEAAPIRFADLSQKLDITLNILKMQLANERVPKGYFPAYKVDFAGEMYSSALAGIESDQLPLGLNGLIEWHYDNPYGLVMKDMDMRIMMLIGRLDAKIDFRDLMTLESLALTMNPVRINDLIKLIPEAEAKARGIPRNLDTNAEIIVSAKLNRPFVVGQVSMPYASLSIDVPECRLKYEKLDLRRLALDVDVDLPGGAADDIKVAINRLYVQGPATALDVKGTLTSCVSDPLFDGSLHGHMQIDRLPHKLTSMIGATLSGDISLDSHMRLRPSMFSHDKFHNIILKGSIEANNLYYLAYDTLTMVSIPNIKGRFGTNEAFTSKDGTVVDSLLRGTVMADTAAILVSGLDIRVGRLRLGVGADNKNAASDTTVIIPMGGSLSAGTFSLFTISDTAGVMAKNIKGSLSMRRYKGDAHLPSFGLNLHLGRLSTGNNRTRFMVRDGDLRFNISKLPADELSKSRRVLRRLTDSIRAEHPEIPPDSVYMLAKRIRARHHRAGRRVHTAMLADSVEILEWGATNALEVFLHDWKWQGNLVAGRARLFTPSFPLRNRLANLDISFCNDTLSISNLEYKAGSSDFMVSGRFTNIKNGFTSKSGRVPLKGNLKLVSDTIDVNEIANAFFVGASAKDVKLGAADIDDDSVEEMLDKDMSQRPDTLGPLLIPVNLDAQFDFQANNVRYSDLLLNRFTGEMLLYDGAINLHDLNASSAVGAVNMNALYSAPSVKDMHFGFGLKLSDFNIKNFLKLVPAVDSIMPLMRSLSGIVDANIAAASKIDRRMNLDLPTLQAAIRIDGDSLAFLDPDTFNKIAKWLMFKNKNKNIIDHVSAEMIINDGQMRVYPFIFDFDRYKLGIQGYNDFALNFHYHVAVLKSPIPFKFGINISGNIDDMKIRLGGAKFNEKVAAQQLPVVNDTRINLINQIQNVFRRGVKDSDFSKVLVAPAPIAEKIDLDTDTLAPSDSTYLRREGLIP